MSDAVTDATVLETLWEMESEGSVDMIADDSAGSAAGQSIVTVEVIYADGDSQIDGVPTGAYGLERNAHGQSFVYHFPDREAADEWFENVRPDI